MIQYRNIVDTQSRSIIPLQIHNNSMITHRIGSRERPRPRLRPQPHRRRLREPPRSLGQATHTQTNSQSRTQARKSKTYNKNRSRYDSWLNNKGWWGTTADNRMPPRGTVGEPRRIPSTSANMVSNRAREESAVSKSFERPRDQTDQITQNPSPSSNKKRGYRSNESRIRRIQN